MNRKQLRALRKRAKLSLREAAAIVRVAPRSWARWESGERRVSEAHARWFCAAVGAPWKD